MSELVGVNLEDCVEEITERKYISLKSTTEEEISEDCNSCIDPNVLIDSPEDILTLNDSPILRRGYKSFVCGASKTRQTTYLTLIASILCGRSEEARGFKTHRKSYRVLYIDTGQSRYFSEKIFHRVTKLCGKEAKELPLKVLPLNDKSPEDIRKYMECAIIEFRPDVVILDLWTDCVNSINDEIECNEFSKSLQRFAEYYNLAIYGVIHANECDRKENYPNFRGWGKIEERRCMVATYLKDEGNYSSIRFRSKHRKPNNLYIGFDNSGLPTFIDSPRYQTKKK